jgi:anti-sigma factor RsiW
MRLASTHISFERLADMVEGRVSAEETAGERAHIADCQRCTAQATELERVTTLMRADTSADAPRDLVFGAIQMFHSRRTESAPGLLRRIVAALAFDSSTRTPAFGVRSGQAAPARQLLFGAGDFDVDLRLAAGEEGWTVSGQVLGPCEGGRVEAFASGDSEEAAARASLNDLCEFTLPPVPEGVYALRLRLNDTEIEIPELSLKA